LLLLLLLLLDNGSEEPLFISQANCLVLLGKKSFKGF